MRNLVKLTVIAFITCLMATSCTKSTITEDQELYEQGSEGDNGHVKEEREG